MCFLHSCAFKNCQHLTEPGCAVREDWSRHELYVELHEEGAHTGSRK